MPAETEYDKVRIIDANDRARQAFIAAVRTWPEGVQTEKEKEYGCYQIKLKGTPWATHKGAVAGAAAMLGCHLLSAFDSIGYELAGAIDMSGGSEDADGGCDVCVGTNPSGFLVLCLQGVDGRCSSIMS